MRNRRRFSYGLSLSMGNFAAQIIREQTDLVEGKATAEPSGRLANHLCIIVEVDNSRSSTYKLWRFLSGPVYG